jgi:hypothetical protein
MSGLEAAKARFLSPASGATRTDSYHIRIEIGPGEPASFQVPSAFPLFMFRECRGVMQNILRQPEQIGFDEPPQRAGTFRGISYVFISRNGSKQLC